MTIEKCQTCKHAFTTGNGRWYCKKSLVDKDDCGKYEIFTGYNFKPKRVISNDPATIIIWNDDTKTIVKCNKDDKYDLRTGILLCFMKKLFGNNNNYHKILYNAIDNSELSSSILKKEKEVQVVINIPHTAYQAILNANNTSGNWGYDLLGVLCRGVANGTPLPKDEKE